MQTTNQVIANNDPDVPNPRNNWNSPCWNINKNYYNFMQQSTLTLAPWIPYSFFSVSLSVLFILAYKMLWLLPVLYFIIKSKVPFSHNTFGSIIQCYSLFGTILWIYLCASPPDNPDKCFNWRYIGCRHIECLRCFFLFLGLRLLFHLNLARKRFISALETLLSLMFCTFSVSFWAWRIWVIVERSFIILTWSDIIRYLRCWNFN